MQNARLIIQVSVLSILVSISVLISAQLTLIDWSTGLYCVFTLVIAFSLFSIVQSRTKKASQATKEETNQLILEDKVALHLSKEMTANAIVSAEVDHSIGVLNQEAHSQSNSIQSITSESEQIAEAMRGNHEMGTAAAEKAIVMREQSEQSRQSLDTCIQDMHSINESTTQAAKQIESLGVLINKVSEVADTIDAIADQTNLLALNAAIEAARAGEHGRGFAVVAEEVRTLASRTTSSTEEVSSIIRGVLEESKQVEKVILALSDDAERSAAEVQEVGSALVNLSHMAQEVDACIESITSGSEVTQSSLQTIHSDLLSMQSGMEYCSNELESLKTQSKKLMENAESGNEVFTKFYTGSDHQKFYRIASDGKLAIEHAFNEAIESRQISEDQLFDRNYQRFGDTEPAKYTTTFDQFCDSVLPSIQEKLLDTNPELIYAIATDSKGYVPTHNNKFCKPLTGDPQVDILSNRTKRIFSDRVGQRCGSHTQDMLLQTYKRDTGEVMHDLSVPIVVSGKHWGGLRIAYVTNQS